MSLDEMHRPLWQTLAACRGQGPDEYFPTRGWTPPQCCTACPVKRECLNYALEHHIAHGTWGGVSERGRARMVRLGRKGAA